MEPIAAGGIPAGARPARETVEASARPDDLGHASLGDLVGRLSSDISTLMRQEVELAKVEIKQEAGKAGKGAGLFGGTGVAALFALMMLSFAAAWGLAAAIPTGWAFLIIAVIWGAIAAVLFVSGRTELRRVHPVPEQTVQTVKEDVQWAKHPRS